MKKKTRNIRSAYASLSGAKRAVPIILFALALFTGLCFITPDSVGLGKYIGGFFLGLFSVGGYFIPFFLAIHAIFYPRDVLKKAVLSRLIFTLITLFTFSALLHTVRSFSLEMSFSPAEFYELGKSCTGGGFFGGVVGFALMKVFGPVGLIIIAALVFALYITYFFANGKSTLAKILLAILNKISDLASKLKKKRRASKEKKKEKILDKKAPRILPKHEDLYEDEFFGIDNSMSELSVKQLGIKETRRQADLEMFPHLEEKVVHEEEGNKGREIFGEDIYEEPEESEAVIIGEILERVKEEEAQPDSDSADSVFTKDFDPFDFVLNAELEERNASKAQAASQSINEYAEPIKTFSEKEIEAARQRADFEMKKKALLEAEERRKALEEETRKQEKIRELLHEEPEKEKAIYTSGAAFYRPEPNLTENESEAKAAEEAAYASAAVEELYVDRTEKVIDTAEEIRNEESSPETIEFSYAEEEKTESFAPAFKSYEAPKPDEYSYEPKHEPSPLTLERTLLTPYPDEEDEEDISELSCEDQDADEFELGTEKEAPEEDSFFGTVIPEEERNPDVSAYRNMFSVFNDASPEEKKLAEALTSEGSFTEGPFEETAQTGKDTEDEQLNSEEEDYAEDDVPFDISEKPSTPEPSAAQHREAPKPKAPDYSSYKKPSLDLLEKGKATVDENINDEITKNGEKLVDTLAEFNVRATIRSVDVGPRITRYEIVPAKGVRVNSVINLKDDISLNLASAGIRMEAPIPGKSAIGIEIPNKKSQLVYLRDLLETEEFKNAESTTMACFGKDVTGNPVIGDIAKMPHLLIAGATGMGKSVCMNSILISLLYRCRPDELKLILIDPKMVEFNGYNGIPHLLIPVIIDVKQAAGALMWAVEQMDKRYQMLLEHNVRNLDGYNKKMRENPSLGEPIPKMIIVIDELNELMLQARKQVESLVTRIAQKARAAGIHLIVGTQRPSVDVITGVIKANIPSRIACKVTSFTDSKTIIEQAGAEDLLDKGDMLYWPVGKPKPTRVQGAYVSDEEVEKIMEHLKRQNKGEGYDEAALEEINRAAQKYAKGGKGGFDDSDDSDGNDDVGFFNDPQFIEAVNLAVQQGKIATSLIQRKIGVGYGKAAKFIDVMEEQGFVSEPNGQKPREVLISKDEWHEILARRSLD